MKSLSYAIAVVTAAVAAGYLVVYLYRWEWHRALLSGVILLVIEVVLVGAVILARMARLERQVADSHVRIEQLRRRLEQSREASDARFRWVGGGDQDGTHRTYVFVPVLMATGIVLSAAAWVVQKIAGGTVRPTAERHLAGRLAALAAPPETLNVRGTEPVRHDLEARPAVPPPRPGRAGLLAVAVALVAASLWALIGALADATQTRPASATDSAATTVVYELEVRGEETKAAERLAARQVWESCRRATFVQNERASLARLGDGIYAGVLRPALGDHDLLRLRGCISDSQATGVHAQVLGEGQAS